MSETVRDVDGRPIELGSAVELVNWHGHGHRPPQYGVVSEIRFRYRDGLSHSIVVELDDGGGNVRGSHQVRRRKEPVKITPARSEALSVALGPRGRPKMRTDARSVGV